MSPELPPQAAPAPQAGAPAPSPEAAPQGQAPEGGGGAGAIIADVNTKLLEVKELMGSSPAITPQDKQRLDGIITEYQAFVRENLQGSGGAQQAPAAPQAGAPAPDQPIPAGQGTVSQEAGATPVRPVL